MTTGPFARFLTLLPLLAAALAAAPPLEAATLTSRPIGAAGLVVELSTGTIAIQEADDLPLGYSVVSLDGLPRIREAGRPELPYRSFLVGVPSGTRVRLTSTGLDTRRHAGLTLAPFIEVGGSDFVAPGQDAPPAAMPAHTRLELAAAADPAVYSSGRPYPESLAVVHSTGFLRDQQFAEIRLHPVVYDPLRAEIAHHARIRVRLQFVAEGAGSTVAPVRIDPDPRTGPAHLRAFEEILKSALINYSTIAPERAARRLEAAGAAPVAQADSGLAVAASPGVPTALGGPGVVKVFVKADDIYQLTPADLTMAGVDVSMLDPQTFHMSAGGVDVPILVDGEGDGSFDPGDRVIFFGKGIQGSRFTRSNVYLLAFNSTAGPRMPSRSGAFTGAGATPASFMTTVRAEVNQLYTQTIRPGVTEAWYWALQTRDDPGSDPRNYPVTTPRVDPAAHTIEVRAGYLGLTNGNHTPRLRVNGTQVAETTFAGQISFTQQATGSSTLLTSGANTLNVDLISNGNFNDRIATDFFEVDYRRTYAVDGDRLMFDGEGAGAFHFALSNLGSSDIVLLDVTTPGAPQWITVPPGQIGSGPPFTASFEDILASDRAYAVSTRAALRAPDAVELDIPSNLMSSANGADYIIISDRSLLAALQPLADHRQAQGLRVALVALDDIYDEFNFGVSRPLAIQQFLQHAFASWSAPAPAYVVLAGDGHVDYRDDFGSGAPNVVPPFLTHFPSIGESPSDNEYVSVMGADDFPDMFVGRLPARSPADVSVIVSKIIQYETAPPVATLNAKSLYVADNNDVIFQAILNNLMAFTPATMGAATAYLPGNEQGNPPSQAQKDATTDAIIDGMNSGSLVQIYLGHGGVSLWALEKILEHNPNPPAGSGARLDADRLTDSGNLGFLVGLNCINGYFVDLAGAGPGHVDYSLAEEWVRRPNRGAVASWAPSALGQLSDYDSIAYELFNHVFVEGQTTIGPAAVGALVDAVTVFGVSTNNIRGMILFGDPATRLALDSDADGLVDYREDAAGSDPLDADSDDDGLADGQEVLAFGTSPTAHDSDGDGVLDGTEAGVTSPGPGTDAGAGFFVPDSDPLTTTDPGNPDTDGGGAQDGDEDLNANGAVDPGETDPNVPGDDLACPGPPVEVTGLLVSRVGADVVLSWDPPAGVPCATFQVYAAADAPFPKSSIAPFTMIGTSSGASFTHSGAGAGTVAYDYLIVMVHPQQGAGPFGAYGQ